MQFFNLRGEPSLPADRRMPPRHYVLLRIMHAQLTARQLNVADLIAPVADTDDPYDADAVRHEIAALIERF